MCCGQKRAELRTSPATTRPKSPSRSILSSTGSQTVRRQGFSPSPAQAAPGATQAEAPQGGRSIAAQFAPASIPSLSVMVRYVEVSPIRVQGLRTGRTYEFSGQQPIQAVDANDAASLLATRFFRRG